VLAKVIGSISTSSLAFQNPGDAVEVLSVLSAEPQITAAALYDSQGKVFARFPEDAPDADIPTTPGRDGSFFGPDDLTLFQPVLEKGNRLGTIYMRANLSEMYSRLLTYGSLVLIVCIVAIVGSLAASTRLQQRISGPIGELAQTARAISEKQDYSVRATRHGLDEIGDFTDAFNQMLTRIEDGRAALSASEERLRLALEGSEMGTWDWNLLTHQITWDDFMFPLHGIEKKDWKGNPQGFFDLVHPEDRALIEQKMKEAIQSHKDVKLAFRIYGADGHLRHMATRGRVFLDSQGRPFRMSGVSMDVTQAKEIEEALQTAKNNAEAANRAKDEFLAILSHELRTPLTPVLATLAMLEESPDKPASFDAELEMIRRNVEVEARLIDDLLDITRIARGKLELYTRPVDLRGLLNHAVDNYLRGPAAQKNQQVRVNIEPANAWIQADASRITQVLWNLLQNACKFTPPEGSITIDLFTESGPTDSEKKTEVIIQVSDTGIGIEPQIQPLIFDAFEQGDPSRTRRFGGLGLGLAISRALVEMHGGKISASSPGPQKGATFTLKLPLITQVDEKATAPTIKEKGSDLPVDSLHILLVEDHVDSAQQLSRLLKRAGHRVTAASNLDQARQALQRESFDLLLSDLGLPDGSGHDLMREVMVHHPMPGIALSGYGMEEDFKESYAAGFSRHFTKPVNWPELKVAIQNLAPKEQGSTPLPEATNTH